MSLTQKKKPHAMTKKTVFILMVAIVTSCSQNKDESTKPIIKDITESVYASVDVIPEDSYYPQSTVSGILDEIYVEEGDTVKTGDLIFKITPNAEIGNRLTTAELNLEEAQSNYKGKDNLLLNLQSEMESVKKQLQLDSLNFMRQKRLQEQNIGKKVDFDRAKLTYEATQNQLAILNNRYAQTKVNLKSNYQKALSRLNTEKENLSDFYIRSKIDGRIYVINKEVGELINPQEKLAEVGSAEKFILSMDIDEVDITKIALGDTVIVSLESYPDETYKARVDKIYPKKDELTQTFKVESKFITPPSQLYNGLSGEANIVVARKSNALIIPSEYLISGNKVKTEDGEIPVKVGVKSMDYIEIREGIDSSTTLLKPEL